MDTKASLEASIKGLPPISRFFLKLMLLVGAVALAFKMGFFSWSGFLTISSIIAIFAMIFFAICNAEEETRNTFYQYKDMISVWFKEAMADQVKEEKTKTKTPA